MTNIIRGLCCLLGISLVSGNLQGAVGESEVSPPAKATVVPEESGVMHPGTISAGVKANDAYVDGHFSIVAPLWSSLGRDGVLSGDLFFVEPYISWGEGDEQATSLGLGWRHLFGNQSTKVLSQHDGHQAGLLEEGLILGANVFVDMLDTEADNRFWQLGVGLEAETRYVALRGNYYIPLSDRKLAEEIRQSTSLGTAQQVTYDEPFATGHSIQQDATFTTYKITLEQLFRRYEEGMEGWDVEMAVLVPWIDRWIDVQLIGGYYSFSNQPFGPQTYGTGDVEGWKAGLEVRPVPAVVLTGMWYEDEKLTGSDWIVGASLELPFEAGDLGDGKGFWGRIRDALRPRRRHLVERMAEPVRRQNVAIKTGQSVEEVKSERQVVTTVVSRTEKRIVLASTVVFVDNAIGAPTNPGTYEAPLDTMQRGENQSGLLFGNSGVVFVQGRNTPYGGLVDVSQSTAFYGSGRGYPALGGLSFHGRTTIMPVLNGDLFAFSNLGIDSLTIDGFHFLNGGIVTRNVRSLVIVGNVFEQSPLDAMQLQWSHLTAGTAYIADNVIQGPAGSGIFLITDTGGVPFGSVSVVLNGNTILNADRNGIELRGPNIQINGNVSNTILAVGTGVAGGVRYTGGGIGRFIINQTIVSSLPSFP